MAGAVPFTSLGAGYLTNPKEPKVTMVASLIGTHQICVRETKTWKKIVAEFLDEGHAKLLLRSLRRKQSRKRSKVHRATGDASTSY